MNNFLAEELDEVDLPVCPEGRFPAGNEDNAAETSVFEDATVKFLKDRETILVRKLRFPFAVDGDHDVLKRHLVEKRETAAQESFDDFIEAFQICGDIGFHFSGYGPGFENATCGDGSGHQSYRHTDRKPVNDTVCYRHEVSKRIAVLHAPPLFFMPANGHGTKRPPRSNMGD